MLLSSSKFTRTMMDDFVDQDWFEESAEDEVVKQHPLMGVESQQPPQSSPLHTPLENGFGCFHSAPIHGQTDFLELNVPVDEMFFGANEIAAPQLVELDTHNQQQKMNAKVVQEMQQKPPPIECHQQLGTQTQIEGVIGSVQQNGLGTHQREPFYADWPPTTSSNSFSTVQPMPTAPIKIHKQNGRDNELQQQRQRHVSQQQQQRWTSTLGENSQPQYQQQYGGGQPTTKLASGNAFPMAKIIVHDQSASQFPQQPYCRSLDGIETLQQNALFHTNYSSPPNNQNMPTFSEQQQIVMVDEQLQQRHFPLTMRMDSVTEFRPVQNQLKSTKRPSRAKSSVNNSQKSAAFGPQHVQGDNGTQLDQIATMLFSNSNLATVQFDPQKAIEFAQVLEQTKLLREQEEQGIDVRKQLCACEARIAELVQNAMAQQGNGTTAATTSATTQGTMAKKKSKARRKAPAKAEQQQQNVQQRTNGIAQPMQMTVPSTVPLTNGRIPIASTCQQPMVPLPSQEVICQQLTKSTIGLNSFESNKFEQYSVHSELPSSSYSHPIPSSSSLQLSSMPNSSVSSLANSHNLSPSVSQHKKAIKDEIRPIKKQIKKEEKNEAQIALEKERERLRREKERERRRTKLSGAFSALRSSIPTLDYKTPFSDKMDCVKRLLPFGLFAEPELSDEFLQKFDGELQRHSEFLCERLKSLKERFQSVFFTESLCEMKEQRNLLLRLDVEFEKVQLQKDIEANGDPFSFPIVSSSNLLDWEYDDNWDRDRYRDISPFISPSHSPENYAEFGGETKDEITDDEEITLKETEQKEREDCAETPNAKIGTIRLTLPTYMEGEKEMADERSDGQHSPYGGKSEQHKDEKLEQYQQMHHDENEDEREDAFCCSSNEVKQTKWPSNESLFVHSFAPIKPQEIMPLEVPLVSLVSSSPEILVNEFLCQNNAANCDDEAVEIEGDTIVKTMAKSPLCHSEGERNKPLGQQKNAKEELRKKEEEQQEPVKLKIKLEKNNLAISNIIDEENGHGIGKEGNGGEKRMKKLERKRLKAEKKEKKRQAKMEKERAKKEQRERDAFEDERQPNSSTAQLQNGERQSPTSLKITLRRRLACWKGTNNNVTPEYSSDLSGHGIRSNGENAGTTTPVSITKSNDEQIKPENAGDLLKLRIPKLVLNRNGHGGNSNGEVKSVEHRKKSRKRKSREEKAQEEKNEEESPKKVPRLKLRIGNGCSDEVICVMNAQTTTDTSQYSPAKREISPAINHKQMEKTEHLQTQQSFSPTHFLQSNDSSRIQFSPCCSEESDDDELRFRTNELFSKLCQD